MKCLLSTLTAFSQWVIISIIAISGHLSFFLISLFRVLGFLRNNCALFLPLCCSFSYISLIFLLISSLFCPFLCAIFVLWLLNLDSFILCFLLFKCFRPPVSLVIRAARCVRCLFSFVLLASASSAASAECSARLAWVFRSFLSCGPSVAQAGADGCAMCLKRVSAPRSLGWNPVVAAMGPAWAFPYSSEPTPVISWPHLATETVPGRSPRPLLWQTQGSSFSLMTRPVRSSGWWGLSPLGSIAWCPLLCLVPCDLYFLTLTAEDPSPDLGAPCLGLGCPSFHMPSFVTSAVLGV